MQKLVTVVALAALSIAPPLAASAADSNAVARPNLGSPSAAFVNGPVAVQTCNTYTVPVFGAGSEFAVIPDMRYVEISFVNRNNVAAKKVRFALTSSAGTEIAVDNGTFSSGTTITHGFWPGSPDATSVECAVDSVVFADGSSWTRHASN